MVINGQPRAIHGPSMAIKWRSQGQSIWQIEMAPRSRSPSHTHLLHEGCEPLGQLVDPHTLGQSAYQPLGVEPEAERLCGHELEECLARVFPPRMHAVVDERLPY